MRFTSLFLIFFIVLFAGGTLPGVARAAPNVNVATAPDARSVALGTPATVFAVFVNSGDALAANCLIFEPQNGNSATAASVSYQAIDANGAPVAAPDTPVDIAAGSSQRFLVTITPLSLFSGPYHLSYACDNATPLLYEGVNDIYLTISNGTPPDLIAIFATPSGDGVLRIPTEGGSAAAGGAVVNIGSGGGNASVVVTPDLGGFENYFGIILSICETNSSTGMCLANPTPTVQMDVGPAPKTFSVFATAHPILGVPFFPEYTRVAVTFSDPAAADTPMGDNLSSPFAISGTIRGRASVALTSPGPDFANADNSIFAGIYEMRFRDLQNDANDNFTSVAELVIDDQLDTAGIYHRFDVTDAQGAFLSGPTDQPFHLEGTFDPVARTFTGDMVFVPDLFLQDPPLRGSFTANFDPGRGMRGTYSFKAFADAPEKGRTSGGPASPETLPASSLNIMGTGMQRLFGDCAEITNIVFGTVFDVYIDGKKYGSVTISLAESGVGFVYTGTITKPPLGSIKISGTISNAPDPRIYMVGLVGLKQPLTASFNITDTTPQANVLFNSAGPFFVLRCTKSGVKLFGFNAIANVSVSMEFRQVSP